MAQSHRGKDFPITRCALADLVFLHDGQFLRSNSRGRVAGSAKVSLLFLDDVQAAGGTAACAEGLDAALRKLEVVCCKVG
jgi:hypothetical protein